MYIKASAISFFRSLWFTSMANLFGLYEPNVVVCNVGVETGLDHQ